MDVSAVLSSLMTVEKTSPHEEEQAEQARLEELYKEMYFIDDVHGGKELPHGEIIKARRLEIDFSEMWGYIGRSPRVRLKESP